MAVLNLLVVAQAFPQPDKASGDLRFFTLLSLLARKHRLLFCALDDFGNMRDCMKDSERLERAGIALGTVDLPHVLKQFRPDVAWFEFYHQAREDYLDLLRRHHPEVRVLVDSVDVHFNRLLAQASLTGKAEDRTAALLMKERELAAYSQAELVVAVSEDDALLLREAMPGMQVVVVPNVHVVPPLSNSAKRMFGELIFVGGFKHAPNVDAMQYFCSEVLPLIVSAHPEVRLKIVGSSPPESIQALAGPHVEVVGYVPETAPYLESAYISVAPLRYGGGMKGKVGEAMSFSLPVVTTSYGAEGFGLEVGQDVLVGDTAQAFAAAVIALLENTELHTRLALNGRKFIEQHYSISAVELKLDSCIQTLLSLPPRKRKVATRLGDTLRGLYDRHIAWRFTQS
jgi:glycosyltransferase involved in cell wall biosynthesis